MIAALQHIGRLGIGAPYRDWLDVYIAKSDELVNPQRAVPQLMRRLWLFNYAFDGLDYMKAQGIDIERVMETCQ
jgi:hypothetical protein